MHTLLKIGLKTGCLFSFISAVVWWEGDVHWRDHQQDTKGTIGHFANAAATASQTAPSASREPVPPAIWLETNYVPPTGRTINVAGGATAATNLQTALNQAQPGDVIALAMGATFTGNFTLPYKSGVGWIVIRPAAEQSLPPVGTRITSATAKALPKILTPNADAALKTMPRAHHYRLIGLEIGVAPGVADNHGLVLLGDGSRAQNSLNLVPHDLIIDRCYIHGAATGNVARGIALNSARTAVLDSYIADCHGTGFDTQAICGWNGPGPFKLVNNYLEGAGENVMFGGADPAIPNLVPADIEFRANHCAKPLTWKRDEPGASHTKWSVKNLFELKNARRVLIAGNLFEHNWVDAQNGFAILFTVRNQDGGAPWSVVEDIAFTDNLVRHAAAGINILGRDNIHPSQPLQRLLIKNNLFEDIGGARWGANGRFLQLTETAHVTVDHNTINHTGNLIFGYGAPNSGFVFTNNVAPHNEYGVMGDAVGMGNTALEKFFPNCLFKRNLLAGGRSAIYPADNFFAPAQVSEASQPQQAPTTKHAGTDGQMIGCDLTVLQTVAARAQTAR